MGQNEQGRPDQIKLLLNPQRPEMQQWFLMCRDIKVPGLPIKQQIGHKPRTRGHALSQRTIFRGPQNKPSRRQ